MLPESEFIPPPMLAAPTSGDGVGRKGKSLFEPKASCFSRRRIRAPQAARNEVKGRGLGVAFSFGYFAFGEAKEK